MAVDVWGGMNQGLASLNNTFDDLARQRQVDEQQARQARLDALQEPILRAQGETANLNAEEARRKITDLRAYDAARKELEANPGTVPTSAMLPNPDYIPPREQMGPSLPRTMDVGEGAPVSVPDTGMPQAPAQGLPQVETAGARPLNPSEMASQRMMLAVQHGQYDEVAKIGTILDITDKIQGNESAMLAKMMANARVNRQMIGPEAALAQLKREAIAAGIPQEMVDKFTMNRDGIVSYPDGQGGIIAIVETPDGKFHVQHVAAKEAKSPSQIDVEIKAAQGDPLATKILRDQESRKARLKQIEAGSGGGAGGGPYVPNTPVGVPGERNEAVLRGLTANEAATVKGLTDYRIAPLSGFVLKSPWGQKMIGAAQMYDPSFDYTQYVSRQKAKNDFTSGKAAVNLRSLNTAVYHLDTLDKKLEALDNSNYPAYNEIANRTITAYGDKRVTGAKGAVTAVVSELAGVFKGMGATDQEINAWRDNFPIAGSRAQQKEAVNTGIELMFGRIKALESQYEGAMGRQKDFRFLSPESRKILKGLGANVDSIDEVAGTGAGARSESAAQPAPAGATHAATRDANGNWVVTPVGR